MNYTDLIQRLRETSQALDALAGHLSELQNTDIQDTDTASAQQTAEQQENNSITVQATENSTENIIENIMQTEVEDVKDTMQHTAPTAQPVNTNPQRRQNQQKPPLANMLGNLMRGMNPGLPNIPGLPNMTGLPNLANMPSLPGLDMQNMPKSLEELQANPQLMSMLDNVRNNPQMLNMISSISGLDSNRITQALQSIQPQASATPAPTSTSTTANLAPANAAAAMMNAAQMPQITQSVSTAQSASMRHLDSLLSEWRWQPYARVWSS